jgi:hypothetical protein
MTIKNFKIARSLKDNDTQNLKEICHGKRAGDRYVRIVKPALTTEERIAALRASAREIIADLLVMLKRILTD